MISKLQMRSTDRCSWTSRSSWCTQDRPVLRTAGCHPRAMVSRSVISGLGLARESTLHASRVRRLDRRVMASAVTDAPVVSVEETSKSAAPAHLPTRPLKALQEAPLGLTLYEGGEATFRVWAPHAAKVFLELKEQPGEPLPLSRSHDIWEAQLQAGMVRAGAAYRVLLDTPEGERLERRDVYARSADYDSAWCFAEDPTAFEWKTTSWQPPPFENYLIYEMHVGSYTPEGTFASAAEKLAHIAGLGFKAVQLMPVTEHSDAWGYNARQLLALHRAWGKPDDLRAFVDKAHSHGLAVIIDVVLHHGAPELNELWNYDGWGPNNNGGIYHEGAPDTEWGRQFAFWKGEMVEMVASACSMWLEEYRVDGLRFDSANDLPREVIQQLTWRLHSNFPGRILTAEVTPENPTSITELGFDSVWVHSGYFDIIQQHKALGRGHHGGGDWADGWNLPRLRTAMCIHYGFTQPAQCIKYILGSHDQVGCRHGGKWYADYQMIGGQHRYACDQFGGGRSDPHARMAARCWWAAGVCAAGLPMMFMGTEWAQPGWWDIDEHRKPNWEFAQDEIGMHMMAAFKDANQLREKFPVLRHGWANIMHEDRANGVMAYERVFDGDERVLVVVNAGRGHWQEGQYGVWVSGGNFQEVYNSQAPKYGGWEGWHSNPEPRNSHNGFLHINLPPQCTLVFKQLYT